MSLIQISNLSFYYDGNWDLVFDKINLQIDTNWKLGLIGRNGKGKTTLIRLLQGKYEYEGSITSSVKFAAFPYEMAENEEQKLAIEIIEKWEPEYELWKLLREMQELEVDAECLYRPYATLSKGEQTKLMLGLLFAKEDSYLLIDEPTNHLDRVGRRLVSQYLQSKSGFLLISHDRSFLDSCIDHVLAFNRVSVQVQSGNFSSWWENKEKADQFEQSENDRLKKDIKKLTQAARQSGAWAERVENMKIGEHPKKKEVHIGTRSYLGEKSRKMQQRRKNLERRQEGAIVEKSILLKDLESVEDLKIMPLSYHKEVLLRVKDLRISYGNRDLFQPIDFLVENGSCTVLCGKNGSGKTSLLKEILGEQNHATGLLEMGSGVVISYISQDTSWLSGSLKDYIEKEGLEESLVKSILRKLDFEREQFEKNMEEFSEGQKKKVLIAQSLARKAHLYIWDEPLNFIDVFSRMQIEELIKRWRPTLLLIEHDEKFVESIHANVVELKC